MKYFVAKPRQTAEVSLIGPFTSVSPAHQWRRLTLRVLDGIPADASVDIATLAYEQGGRTAGDPDWYTGESAAKPEWGMFRAKLLNLQFAIFDDPLRSRTINRTTLAKFTSTADTSLVDSIRVYPKNSTDVALWHESGNRRENGTQLWVMLRIRSGTDSANRNNEDVEIVPWLTGLTVESAESGWERELPEIYSQADSLSASVAQERSVSTADVPVLLDALLRLFESNANAQQEQIDAISDWFIPSDRTTELRKLALHLGMSIDGLDDAQIMKLLPFAFNDFLRRGTPASFLSALKIIYPDEQKKDDSQIEKVIIELREPLMDCRLMILDGSCRLDAENVVVSGIRENRNSTEIPFELTGLEHLVGRARLRVNSAKFKKPEKRKQLETLVSRISPAHMRITVDYVGEPAVLGFGAVVDESILG